MCILDVSLVALPCLGTHTHKHMLVLSMPSGVLMLVLSMPSGVLMLVLSMPSGVLSRPQACLFGRFENIGHSPLFFGGVPP